jgi:serine/threonine protein kinase
MSRVIQLPCGHAYDPSVAGPLPEGTTVLCPICHETCDTPPPPRLAVPGANPLAGRPPVADGISTFAAAVPPAMPATLPVVAGYEVHALLGRGGMGVVYKARQKSLNRLVALKTVLAGPHADTEFLGRFRTEAEAAARLQHPNIVQIHEIGEQDGRPYIALELVDGGSLRDRLSSAPLPPGDAAGLVETLARAMQHAHERGVVHRDLKPANVLLAFSGRSESRPPAPPPAPPTPRPLNEVVPKIADFGLAKQLDSDSGQTRTGAILGTPSYMAPEQAEGRVQDVGPRTDVYALGAILYECLIGRPPFRGATTLETLEQVRLAEPVPVRQLQPKCPRDLETIALKCLRKEPGQRYASAEALAEDLRRFRAGRPIQARPVGQLGRFSRWCRRSPVVASLSAGLFLALAAGLSGVSWKWYEADQQRRRAETAEARAKAEAEAETRARAQMEQAEEDVALTLNYVSANNLARIYLAVSANPTSLLAGVAKRPEALGPSERACQFGDLVLRRHPNGALQGALAKSYAQLSILQAAVGRRDEAARSAGRGVELLNPKGLDNAAALGGHEELGQTAFVLGALLMHLGRHEDAIRPFREAMAHQRAFLAKAPADQKRRKILSISAYHLDHVLLQAGHIGESAASVLERQKLWPDNADEVYDTACELSRCAAKVGAGKPDASLTPEQQAERRHYGDLAVAALRLAIDQGLKGADDVKADGDFTILGDRADFRQLSEEMARKEKKGR